MTATSKPAKQRRSGPSAWFDHHVYSLLASIGRLARKPWASALTIGVMAMALVLPMGLWATLSNVQRFAGDVQQARQVSVYLKTDVAVERARAMALELDGREDIASVELHTPEQGLAELQAGSGLGEALGALEDNPLPSLLIVVPAGDEASLVTALQQLPEVDLVQHDAAWRERLDGWLAFGTRLGWVLALLLGLGALLVVGNTVRLDIQARREEIAVQQLLGATDGFVRRPFLYLGAWYGLLSGCLALGLLAGMAAGLRGPLAELAASYGSQFTLQGFGLLPATAIVVAAGVLGWLGAGMVAGHYLRQARPG